MKFIEELDKKEREFKAHEYERKLLHYKQKEAMFWEYIQLLEKENNSLKVKSVARDIAESRENEREEEEREAFNKWLASPDIEQG